MTDGPRGRRIRIGVQLAPQHVGYPEYRDAVARLEDLGVDLVFNWDHFFPLFVGDPDGAHFESWTVLAAIAQQTTRIEFGSLVNCNSYRNPDLQADMARTIDHISAGSSGIGRFVFGTGAGWFQRDYDEYGYEFGTVGSRIDDLATALPRIEARWAQLNPAPTRRIPVLVGGAGERKTLGIVARHADIWHSFSPPEALAHKLGVLGAHAAEIGRDVREIEISSDVSRGGIAHAERYLELGTTLFTIRLHGPGFPFDQVRMLLDWREGLGLPRASD